ncbi:E3 ubiquitin ligase PARAQUAT TOLERANCE 3 [Linum grandiflorum]
MLLITVHYKFLSAKDFHEIRLPGPYTTVADLKSEIFNAKFKARRHDNNPSDNNNNNRRQYYSIWNGCCLGTDHDLLIIDSKTNTPYYNESALIYDQASVLLRRVPGDRRRRLLDTEPIDLRPQLQETDSDGADSSVTDDNITSKEEEMDIHDFGDDLFDVQQKKKSRAAEEEDMKIKELVDTPALGIWFPGAQIPSRKRNHPYSAPSTLTLPPPPDYYVCHRCGIKGHFIQDCPTNGDPEFDHCKRMRPTVTVDPVAEKEFDKLMEGISLFSSFKTTSTSSKNSNLGGVVSEELHCPLCRSVMRDAVAKRCCFRSFCNGCIRDHVNKSKTCACGAANADAKEDDFVPNNTVRNLIKSILLQKSSSSSCVTSTSVGSSSGSTAVITM